MKDVWVIGLRHLFLLPGRYFAQFRLKKPLLRKGGKETTGLLVQKDAGLKTPFSLKTGRDLFSWTYRIYFLFVLLS
ncbi:hypothetical protein [Dialister hominis]|jgi:hypothetical protein|uniref:hypothetical protein n=1 Tax=Dialister hominis TaxID=2582419 RepID=UPI00265D1924|nr:hypothetical protein [uncultured Dialister sp.]